MACRQLGPLHRSQEMSLVPDYDSSSDEESAPPSITTAPLPRPITAPAPSVPSVPALTALAPATAAPAPRKKAATSTKSRKARRPVLFLPPEIQRLLESGAGAKAGDSDDDDGDSLLSKRKRALATAKRSRPTATTSAPGTSLSFLPAPKHHLEAPAAPTQPAEPAEDASVSASSVDAAAAPESTTESVTQQNYDPQTAAYSRQQQQQQQQYQEAQYYQTEEIEEMDDRSSKRARHRERDLERALLQGDFGSVASRVVDVQGPAPGAWEAPVEQLQRNPQDVKVTASFWNSQAGTTVSSMKPSRMQRQKHQLNQLAHDAKLREFELLDKKGASIKTKAETHAKYGW